MKRGDWGVMGRESSEEECEMFTKAGLHKETRDGGGKTTECKKSKHADLLLFCRNITPFPAKPHF